MSLINLINWAAPKGCIRGTLWRVNATSRVAPRSFHPELLALFDAQRQKVLVMTVPVRAEA